MTEALSAKPTVLHVITTVARGGAENHLFDLINGQLASGWQVKVAYLKAFGGSYWRAALEALGVQTLDLGLTRYGQIAPLLRLRRFIKDSSPDIIHAHMPPAEVYSRLALVGNRSTPLIISKHNDAPLLREAPSPTLTLCLERWCARRATTVIAISDAVGRFFEQRWPQTLTRGIVIVHYGLNPEPYTRVTAEEVASLRTEWGVSPDEFLIGTVARLTKQKALDVMLRGFAGATAQAPGRRMKLVIVGRGELEDELKMLAVTLGIADRVIFAGFREDVPRVMRSFDLFALTSDFEGFGLVLLEAMSAGKPVLATCVSAIPEVVQDGETGILVPKQDHIGFTTAALRLLDPQLREAMGAAGERRVHQSFSPSVMVRRTLDLYTKAMHAQRTPAQ